MSKELKNIFNSVAGTNDKMMEILIKAIEKANLEGFDYIEFRQSIQKLNGLNLDEASAYKSAFAIASTLGLTVDKLLDTAGFYKQVLEREKTAFNEAINKQQSDKLNAKKAEFNALEKGVADKEAQILQLQQDIADYKKGMIDLKAQLDEMSEKLSITQESFSKALATINSEIDADIAKIKAYL